MKLYDPRRPSVPTMSGRGQVTLQTSMSILTSHLKVAERKQVLWVSLSGKCPLNATHVHFCTKCTQYKGVIFTYSDSMLWQKCFPPGHDFFLWCPLMPGYLNLVFRRDFLAILIDSLMVKTDLSLHNICVLKRYQPKNHCNNWPGLITTLSDFQNTSPAGRITALFPHPQHVLWRDIVLHCVAAWS